MGKKESPYSFEYKLSEEDILRGHVTLDWYDISDGVGIDRSRLDHAGKKVLFAGKRGHKDKETDIKQAIWSLQEELREMQRVR